jgi:hypothetical protein
MLAMRLSISIAMCWLLAGPMLAIVKLLSMKAAAAADMPVRLSVTQTGRGD